MNDRLRYLTGQGNYVDDMPGQDHAHMVVLRAPVAHADEVSLDLDEARNSPGVLAVFGPDDLDRLGVGPIHAQASMPGMREPVRPVLAAGKIAYLGQPLAAVVATTHNAAQDAIDLISLDFSELPPVLDPEVAMDAPPIWTDLEDNRVLHWQLGSATDQDFENAAHRIELTVHHPRTAMSPMEPRACIASFENGRYTLSTGSQGVYGIRSAMARTLGIAEADLRVTTPDVGGSFALKIYPYPEHALALIAARETGRTVRWAATRAESFMSDVVGRARVDHGELALDTDGTFLAFRINAKTDLGAFLNAGAAFIATSASSKCLSQLYDIPRLSYCVDAVVTTQPLTDAYRGAGKPESALTLERLIDKAAQTLNMDRMELRRKNLVRPDQIPYKTDVGAVIDAGDFPGVADRLKQEADLKGFDARKAASRKNGRLRGLGMTFPLHITGGNTAERAALQVLPDGSIELRIGVQDNGQGQRQALALVVAEVMEIPADRITVRTGDSDLMPSGGSTGGSSLLAISGSTAHQTALTLIENMRPAAADHLEASLPDIVYGSGAFSVVGTDRRVTLGELAEADARDIPACAAEGAFDGNNATFPNGGFAAEVEVDPETGRVFLDRFVAVTDLGRIIQEGPAFGQIYGGIAQGMGEAVMEALVADADGQLLTGSFMDYAMPRADDLCRIAVIHQPTPSPNSTLGTKGAGELPMIGAPSAIINAILDAIDCSHLDRPLTSEKIWKACREKADP